MPNCETIMIEHYADVIKTIEKILSKNINTQIYISNEITNLLGTYDKQIYKLTGEIQSYSIYSQNTFSTHHYNSDLEIEKNFYQTTGNAFDKTIVNFSIVPNCKGYNQLVTFKSENIKDYTHFLVEIENIVFIEIDNLFTKMFKHKQKGY